jgi:hypothetical protein
VPLRCWTVGIFARFVVVEVVHGTYDIEVLVVREEDDCDAQVGWGGHGVLESGPLTSSCKLFIHLILTFRCLRNPEYSQVTDVIVGSDKNPSISIPRSDRAHCAATSIVIFWQQLAWTEYFPPSWQVSIAGKVNNLVSDTEWLISLTMCKQVCWIISSSPGPYSPRPPFVV